MLAALEASLTLFQEITLEQILARCGALKQRFMDKRGIQLQVVGLDSKQRLTNMIAVCPSAGHKWARELHGIEGHLWRRGVHALVMSVGGEVWIRVAFPYFLDASEIDTLAAVMRELVVKA